MLNGDRVYAEAEGFKVLDAASGQLVGTYVDHNGSDYSQPAFAGSLGIFRPAAGLIAAGPDGSTAWTFAAEGTQRPMTANGHAYTVVFEGGIDDRAGLVALNLASGAPVWCADLGVRPYPEGVVGPVSGGLGMIVVAVDDRLVAFGNGGGGSTCGAQAGAPPVAAPAPPPAPATGSPAAAGRGTGSSVQVDSGPGPGPRLTLLAKRTSLVLGERTRLSGIVSGLPKNAGVRVRLQADDHPFGRWRTLARPRTRADGTYRVLLKPAKNVRIRALIERAPRVRTSALTVYTELPTRAAPARRRRRPPAGAGRARRPAPGRHPQAPRRLLPRAPRRRRLAADRERPLAPRARPRADRHRDVPGGHARRRRPRARLHARAAARRVRPRHAVRPHLRRRDAAAQPVSGPPGVVRRDTARGGARVRQSLGPAVETKKQPRYSRSMFVSAGSHSRHV